MYLRESLVDWDVVDFDSLQNGWVIEFLVKDPIGTPEQGVFCLEQCYTSKKKQILSNIPQCNTICTSHSVGAEEGS